MAFWRRYIWHCNIKVLFNNLIILWRPLHNTYEYFYTSIWMWKFVRKWKILIYLLETTEKIPLLKHTIAEESHRNVCKFDSKSNAQVRMFLFWFSFSVITVHFKHVYTKCKAWAHTSFSFPHNAKLANELQMCSYIIARRRETERRNTCMQQNTDT